MVLAAGVPAVYKRAAWSVYNSDKDARVVDLTRRLAGIDSPNWARSLIYQPTCYNKYCNSQQYGK